MAIDPAEEATLRTFLTAGKQDRFISLLGNAKRRSKYLDVLNHFDGWDTRYAHSLPSSANVLDTLRQAGAPTRCHIISDDEALDGTDLPLASAVAAAELCSFASLLCCIPGKLAFYFDEIYAPRRRILLRRVGSLGGDWARKGD